MERTHGFEITTKEPKQNNRTCEDEQLYHRLPSHQQPAVRGAWRRVWVWVGGRGGSVGAPRAPGVKNWWYTCTRVRERARAQQGHPLYNASNVGAKQLGDDHVGNSA
jgi:hypothetical protein